MTPPTDPSSLGMPGGGGNGFTPSATPEKESFMVRSENCFVRLFFFFLDSIWRNFPAECFCFSICTREKKYQGHRLFLWEV